MYQSRTSFSTSTTPFVGRHLGCSPGELREPLSSPHPFPRSRVSGTTATATVTPTESLGRAGTGTCVTGRGSGRVTVRQGRGGAGGPQPPRPFTDLDELQGPRLGGTSRRVVGDAPGPRGREVEKEEEEKEKEREVGVGPGPTTESLVPTPETPVEFEESTPKHVNDPVQELDVLPSVDTVISDRGGTGDREPRG